MTLTSHVALRKKESVSFFFFSCEAYQMKHQKAVCSDWVFVLCKNAVTVAGH
jgi:hypothetical protein